MTENKTTLIIPDKASLKDTRDLYLITKSKFRKVNKIDYLAITADFMKFIVELIFHGHKVELPVRCGLLYIKGVIVPFENKMNIDLDDKLQTRTKLAPDWKATKELWEINEKAKKDKKLVFFFNENTAGTTYKVSWNHFRTNIRHCNLYKVTFSRTNKRTIASLIKHGIEYHSANEFDNGIRY